MSGNRYYGIYIWFSESLIVTNVNFYRNDTKYAASSNCTAMMVNAEAVKKHRIEQFPKRSYMKLSKVNFISRVIECLISKTPCKVQNGFAP